MKEDCIWCPGLSFLENRNYSGRIKYLCGIAKIRKEFREDKIKFRRNYFQAAGITFQVDFDLPMTEKTFSPGLKKFQTDKPGDDIIEIQRHLSLPDLNLLKPAEVIHQQNPWKVYTLDGSWIYISFFKDTSEKKDEIRQIGVFKNDYTRAKIYDPNPDRFLEGDFKTLSFYTDDQILLPQILANKAGCILNASGVVLNDAGLIFLGHEDIKTDILKMLEGQGEMLSQEKVIIRKWPEGYKIHPIWDQSFIENSTSDMASLSSVIFIEKSQNNRIVSVEDKKEIETRLQEFIIKPIFIGNWWNKVHPLLEDIANNIQFYILEFDKSSSIIDTLSKIWDGS